LARLIGDDEGAGNGGSSNGVSSGGGGGGSQWGEKERRCGFFGGKSTMFDLVGSEPVALHRDKVRGNLSPPPLPPPPYICLQ